MFPSTNEIPIATAVLTHDEIPLDENMNTSMQTYMHTATNANKNTYMHTSTLGQQQTPQYSSFNPFNGMLPDITSMKSNTVYPLNQGRDTMNISMLV